MTLGAGVMGGHETVTVIVPTHNGRETIVTCLRSLLSQDQPGCELIVVDDGSSDGTSEVARQVGVRTIMIPHSGRSAARNAGLEAAASRWVVFAEDDAVYPSAYVRSLIAGMRRVGAQAAIGPYRVYEPSTFTQKCRDVERDLHFRSYRPFSAWAFETRILRALGGYDEALEFAEDVDLGRRIRSAGFAIAFVPEAIWYHREPGTFASFLRRRYRSGKGSVRYKLSKGLARIPRGAVLLAGIVISLLGLMVTGMGEAGIGALAGVILAPPLLEYRFIYKGVRASFPLVYILGWPYLQALGWASASLGGIVGLIMSRHGVKVSLMGR